MASRQNTIPGEDPQELEEQLEAWVDDLEPEGPAETCLVQNACLGQWKLARATRAANTLLSDRIRNAAQAEENELCALLDRLFHNPQRPAELYGSSSYDPNEPRISWSESPEHRGEPARLVQEIARSAAGCTMLLAQWQALRARLEPGKTLDRHDMFRCIRLLGHQPLDAHDARPVALVFVACWVIEPRGDDPFAPLKDELDDQEYRTYARRVRSRWTDMPQPGDCEGARRALAALVDQAISKLNAKLAAFHENAAAEAARRLDRLSFDGSPEAERLRRYELSCARTVFRSLSELTKLRRAKARDAVPPPPEPDDLVMPSDEPGEGPPFDPTSCDVDSIDEPCGMVQTGVTPSLGMRPAGVPASAGPGPPKGGTPTRDTARPQGRTPRWSRGQGGPMCDLETSSLEPCQPYHDNQPTPCDWQPAAPPPTLRDYPALGCMGAGLLIGAGLRAPEGSPPCARPQVSPRPSTESKVDNPPAEPASPSAPDQTSRAQNGDNEPEPADNQQPGPEQPSLPESLAHGHPASDRERCQLPENSAEPSTPDQTGGAQNHDNEPEPGVDDPVNFQPHHRTAAARSPISPQMDRGPSLVGQPPPLLAGRASPTQLKAAVVESLRRREAEASARDGPPGRDHRRHLARMRKCRRSQHKPPNFDIAFSSPLLAPIQPGEFSKIVNEVHREFELELP